MNKSLCRSALVVTTAVTLLMAGCAGTAARRSTGEVVDDGVLTTSVKTALIENDKVKARQIDVQSYRGEVQLNGFVDSESAKAAAGSAARQVSGVRSVKNNLQIRADRSAGEVIDDGVITARVKAAFIADPRTKAHQIEVTTNAGIVQLAGFVDSVSSKNAAAELATAIDGVRSVSNRLQVRQ